MNDYTDTIVKDVLVAGLADKCIKNEVLGWSNLDTKTVNETITFIESKEMVFSVYSLTKGQLMGVSPSLPLQTMIMATEATANDLRSSIIP